MKNTLSPASHEWQVKGREELILNINWENWAIWNWASEIKCEAYIKCNILVLVNVPLVLLFWHLPAFKMTKNVKKL